MKNNKIKYVNFIEINLLDSNFGDYYADVKLADKILDESDDPDVIKSKIKENMELVTIDVDSELLKCKNLEVCNVAPVGKYRVIGTDTYNKKWIQGDFDLLLYAEKVADKVEDDGNIMSVYNDKGDCIEEIGPGKTGITFVGN
ncbi:MAG: hypothetical protein LLG05_14050 [Porphyromonadaceae bacterium]|nr:hypothetical protein [Porphyromonadaceae bacterium]